MKLKRAILISLALYAATFIIGVILTLIARQTLPSPGEIPTTYWVITIVVTVLLTCLASLWYFNKNDATRNIKEGLKLGITFVVIGFILDILLFIPTLISTGSLQVLVEYYKDPTFYLVMILVIASATFISSRGPNKKRGKNK